MHELDPKEIKRQRRWVKVFLTIALISGAIALLQAVHLHFDPMAERHYGRLVHVRIADRDFAIPSEYFRGPIPRGKTSNLHLWVMMPDYTPYRGEISGDRAHIDAGWEQHLIVMVDDSAVRGELKVHYNTFRNGPLNSFKPEDVEDKFGLKHTLVWYSNARSPDPWILHDLYFQKDSRDSLSLFISCDRDQSDIASLCSFHEFQEGRLLFTLSYRKSNLPNWKLIQDRILSLIDSFSCVPNSISISNNNKYGEQICPP